MGDIFVENAKYLRKKVFKPYLKMALMRLIVFYQKHFSKHTCMFLPTCSEYMLESINNRGVLVGILLGTWRLLRCHPFQKKGKKDYPLEKRAMIWLL